MVQLDESAIAGNVGRDLAYAASRLAARSHPVHACVHTGVGACAAPSSLVIFGILLYERVPTHLCQEYFVIRPAKSAVSVCYCCYCCYRS